MQEAVRKSLKKALLKGMTESPLQEFVDSIVALIEKIDGSWIRPMPDEDFREKERSRQVIKKQYLAFDDRLKIFAELIIYRAGFFDYPVLEMKGFISAEACFLVKIIKEDNTES